MTSRETIQKLLTEMKTEFENNSGDLASNRLYFDQRGQTTPLPDGVHTRTIAINEYIQAEQLSFQGNTSGGTILFYHGGGYSVGSIDSHRPLCALLTKHSELDVLNVGYRLAPENKFPCALDDACQSYEFLLAQGKLPQEIIIAGDSAGGGLAFATLLKLRQDNRPLPAGMFGLSAWLDLECSSPSYDTNGQYDLMATKEGLRFVGRGYASKDIATNPLVSPFYETDLSGLCPFLFQVGSDETLLDEARIMVERGQSQGVPTEIQIWPNMVHVWHSLYGVIPEAEEALNAVTLWCHSILGN
jgi:acetyl esterase/lipase